MLCNLITSYLIEVTICQSSVYRRCLSQAPFLPVIQFLIPPLPPQFQCCVRTFPREAGRPPDTTHSSYAALTCAGAFRADATLLLHNDFSLETSCVLELLARRVLRTQRLQQATSKMTQH